MYRSASGLLEINGRITAVLVAEWDVTSYLLQRGEVEGETQSCKTKSRMLLFRKSVIRIWARNVCGRKAGFARCVPISFLLKEVCRILCAHMLG
jgi:hypothetical protein